MNLNPHSSDEVMPEKQSFSPLQRFVSRRSAIKFMGLSATTAALTPLVLGGCQTAARQARQSNTGAIRASHRQATAQATPPTSPPTSELITKLIPGTNERIPAIGLGTFLTFDVLKEQPRDNLREVLRGFWEGGGRMVDVSPLYGMSEENLGEFTPALGLTDQLFIANKIWATVNIWGMIVRQCNSLSSHSGDYHANELTSCRYTV